MIASLFSAARRPSWRYICAGLAIALCAEGAGLRSRLSFDRHESGFPVAQELTRRFADRRLAHRDQLQHLQPLVAARAGNRRNPQQKRKTHRCLAAQAERAPGAYRRTRPRNPRQDGDGLGDADRERLPERQPLLWYRLPRPTTSQPLAAHEHPSGEQQKEADGDGAAQSTLDRIV